MSNPSTGRDIDTMYLPEVTTKVISSCKVFWGWAAVSGAVFDRAGNTLCSQFVITRVVDCRPCRAVVSCRLQTPLWVGLANIVVHLNVVDIQTTSVIQFRPWMSVLCSGIMQHIDWLSNVTTTAIVRGQLMVTIVQGAQSAEVMIELNDNLKIDKGEATRVSN